MLTLSDGGRRTLAGIGAAAAALMAALMAGAIVLTFVNDRPANRVSGLLMVVVTMVFVAQRAARAAQGVVTVGTRILFLVVVLFVFFMLLATLGALDESDAPREFLAVGALFLSEVGLVVTLPVLALLRSTAAPAPRPAEYDGGWADEV